MRAFFRPPLASSRITGLRTLAPLRTPRGIVSHPGMPVQSPFSFHPATFSPSEIVRPVASVPQFSFHFPSLY